MTDGSTKAVKLAKVQPRCGAWARSRGRPCREPAGKRTDHPGVGRCWRHGGATPVTHGKYSQAYRSSIGELYEKHRADPDPLNMLDELAMLRALTERYIARYEEFREQLDEWYRVEVVEKTGSVPRPPRLLDLNDARVLLTDVSKMVKRIEDIRAQNAISRPELMRLMTEMGRAVDHVLSSSNGAEPSEQKAAIMERWSSIRLLE